KFCKLNSHPPSTGKSIGDLSKIFPFKTKAHENFFSLTLVVITPYDLILMGDFAKFLYKLSIPLAFIIGTGNKLVIDIINFLLDFLDLNEGLLGFFQHGPALYKVYILL